MPTETMPKPWDHRILTRPLTIDDTGIVPREGNEDDSVIAYCTCLTYERGYPAGADALGMVTDAAEHLQNHPLKPLSMVQVGNAETGDVIMVMEVPGMGEEKTVHMSVAVPLAVFNDNEALAKFLGPIGSPVHFGAEQQRRFAEEHAAHIQVLGPIARVEDMQGLISFLQGSHPQEEGENDDGQQE